MNCTTQLIVYCSVMISGDLALLVDTSHPMIRPDLEVALDNARKILQSRGSFCLELDFGPALDQWMKVTYPRGCCTIGSIRSHKARLCITNYGKPQHCFDCNALWGLFLGPCWLFSAPCYKVCEPEKHLHINNYVQVFTVLPEVSC